MMAASQPRLDRKGGGARVGVRVGETGLGVGFLGLGGGVGSVGGCVGGAGVGGGVGGTGVGGGVGGSSESESFFESIPRITSFRLKYWRTRFHT